MLRLGYENSAGSTASILHICFLWSLESGGVAWFLCQVFMKQRTVDGSMTKQSHYEMGPA